MKKIAILIFFIFSLSNVHAQTAHTYFLAPLATSTSTGEFNALYSKYEPAIYCSASYFGPDSASILMKTDLAGNPIWTKGYKATPGVMFTEIRNVVELPDTTLIVTVYMYYRSLYLHIDKNGNLLSEKQLFPYTANIYETHFSDGYLYSPGTGVQNNLTVGTFIKSDTSGNIVWEKSFSTGPGGGIALKNVWPTHDKGWLIAGNRNLNSVPSQPEMVFFRLDSMGNLLWQQQHFITGNYTNMRDGMETSTHDFIFIHQFSFTGGNYISKMDSIGNMLWTHKYELAGTMLTFTRLHPASNGNVLVSGLFMNNYYSPFAMIIDTSGNVLWNHVYESRQLQYFDGSDYHPNHGLVFFGGTDVFGQTRSYLYLKTDSLLQTDCTDFSDQITVSNFSHTDSICNYSMQPFTSQYWSAPTAVISALNETFSASPFVCSPTGIIEETNLQSIEIFPNPAPGVFEIKNAPANSTISLFDLGGKEVYRHSKPTNNIITVPGLGAGYYLMRVMDNKSGMPVGYRKIFLNN